MFFYHSLFFFSNQFLHKGLKRYYTTGSISGIPKKHVSRIRLILTRLDAAIEPADLNLPGLKLYKLGGNLKGFYSVAVQANWRIIFRFESKDVCDVEYIDYH